MRRVGREQGAIRWSRNGRNPLIYNGVSYVRPGLWGRRRVYVIAALDAGYTNINDYDDWQETAHATGGGGGGGGAPVNRPSFGESSGMMAAYNRNVGTRKGGQLVKGRNMNPGRAVSRSYTRPHAGGNRGYGDEHILVQQGLRERVGLDVEIGPDVAAQSGLEILDQMVAVNTLQAEARVVTSGNVLRISVDGYAAGDIDEVFHLSNSIPSTDSGGGEWCKSFLMRGIPGDSFFLLRNPLVNGSGSWDSSAGATAIVTRTQDGPPRMITLGSEGFAVVDLLEVVGAQNGTTRWGLQANQTGNIAFASFFQREGIYADLIIAPRQ